MVHEGGLFAKDAVGQTLGFPSAGFGFASSLVDGVFGFEVLSRFPGDVVWVGTQVPAGEAKGRFAVDGGGCIECEVLA